MQAAILSAKLPHSAAWTEARQAAADVYDAGLNQIEDVVRAEVAPERSHVYHLYTIRHPRRDALAAHLQCQRRADRDQLSDRTAVPGGLCAARPPSGAVPECAPRPGQILSLPMFAEISREQQDEVIDLARSSKHDPQKREAVFRKDHARAKALPGASAQP